MKTQKNLGLEILRTFLCFWVVIFHCCKKDYSFLKIFFKKLFHVPTFMIISFYFFSLNLSLKKINKIKERFVRISIPYIIWPLIFFIINNFFFTYFGNSLFQRNLTLKSLLFQLVFGRIFYRIFWFQFNLIFLTFVFTIIFFLFKNQSIFILQIVGFISYYLQYSSLNYKLFKEYKPSIRHSIGSIFEMMPFAVIGAKLGSLNIVNLLSSKRKTNLFFSLIILVFLFKYDIFLMINGFSYPGIELNLGAIFLFICFSIIIFKVEINKSLNFIIFNLTKYTGGIYYLHILLRNYLKKRILLVKNRTFSGSIIIYIICYILCLIGIKIFGKSRLKNLFY